MGQTDEQDGDPEQAEHGDGALDVLVRVGPSAEMFETKDDKREQDARGDERRVMGEPSHDGLRNDSANSATLVTSEMRTAR